MGSTQFGNFRVSITVEKACSRPHLTKLSPFLELLPRLDLACLQCETNTNAKLTDICS
jgi:hypothetical protein